MSHNPRTAGGRLAGHALRNANLRARSLARAQEAAPLARALVILRARVLGMTRLEFARQSGISRGTLRDLELGIHTPTRRILHQFTDFCRGWGVDSGQLDELYSLYAGELTSSANGTSANHHPVEVSVAKDERKPLPAGGLGPILARLEVIAGSPRELARRAGISPATLWEYRRGNFPLPLKVLRRLYQAVGEDPTPAEVHWFEVERQRLLVRGYPRALAEFWALCARAEVAEAHLPGLGLSTAALRRLRYLELPAWKEIAGVARPLCQSDHEFGNLQRLWQQEERQCGGLQPDSFGSLLQQFREQKGLSRREIADLFRVRGKKPARIIQSIEEKGCYSARAYPAGLAALLARDARDQARMVELWQDRRKQFHRRHRPETRIDLRLARELYGFEHKDMEAILGYTPLEYQRIERGIESLSEAAQARILQAIHQAGGRQVKTLLVSWDKRQAERVAWRCPPSLREMVALLADREGGIIPLTRHLRQARESRFWAGRLRSIAQGKEVPPWPLIERIGRACGVADLSAVRADWQKQYRARLQQSGCSALATEVRLLIAEVATTIREFSTRLKVNPSVLVRDLQRMDQGKAVKWFHVERILSAAGVRMNDRRWDQVHAWWYTTRDEE
jgi:transcriptional regulator with XRE-family HTH domain